MTLKTKIVRTLVIMAVLLFALWPFQTPMSPPWTVRVVDTEGRPISSSHVEQTWQHFTFQTDSDTQYEEKFTDSSGVVDFPSRAVRANIFVRFAGAVRNLSAGVHASWGPHVWITVKHDDYESNGLEYLGKGTPPSVIVLTRR